MAATWKKTKELVILILQIIGLSLLLAFDFVLMLLGWIFSDGTHDDGPGDSGGNSGATDGR